MELPFTRDEFFEVFRQHSELLGVGTFALLALGVLTLALALRSTAGSRVLVYSTLAFMWALNGVLYHWVLFAPINPAARVFAVAFVLQALLLAVAAWRTRTTDVPQPRIVRITGLVLCAYALLIYMPVGFLHHGYAATPRFGAAPCPTTIFTLGILLVLDRPVPWWLLPIPLLWAAVGGSAAVLLGVPEDFGLIVAGAATLVLGIYSRLRSKAAKQPAPGS